LSYQTILYFAVQIYKISPFLKVKRGLFAGINSLHQYNTMLSTLLHHVVGPQTGLNLTNVCFLQKIHTQARLPYSTTNRQWQFAF